MHNFKTPFSVKSKILNLLQNLQGKKENPKQFRMKSQFLKWTFVRLRWKLTKQTKRFNGNGFQLQTWLRRHSPCQKSSYSTHYTLPLSREGSTGLLRNKSAATLCQMWLLNHKQSMSAFKLISNQPRSIPDATKSMLHVRKTKTKQRNTAISAFQSVSMARNAFLQRDSRYSHPLLQLKTTSHTNLDRLNTQLTHGTKFCFTILTG